MNDYIKKALDASQNDKVITLDECKEHVRARLTEISDTGTGDEPWNEGYTQAMLDVFNLMHCTSTWDK